MSLRRLPTIDLQDADERALHEDFKRLSQLASAKPLVAPLRATVSSSQTDAVEATCVEVSNESVGLTMPESARPQVGETLELLALRNGNAELMSGVTCEVTRVSEEDGTGVVKVSARFHPRDEKLPPALRITNPLRVRAVIESVSKTGERFSLGASSRVTEQVSGTVVGDALYLTTPNAEQWQREQVVSVSFTLEGRPLSGFAKVLRGLGEALVLALPVALVEPRQGIQLRSLTFQELGSVIFSSPLTGVRCSRKVVELSTGGLRFKLDPSDVLPAGLELGEVVLSLGRAHLQVQAVVSAPGRLQFKAVTGSHQLLDVLLAARVEGAQCATHVRHAALRRFFREEGVAFRDHAEVPRSPVGDGVHGLGKSIAIVRDGELIAHCGGLRVYSRTWLAQHLLVKSGMHRVGSLSQQLMALSFEYGEALPDVDFVRGLFRVTSGNAERIFSVVSGRVLKPGLGYQTQFEQLRIRAGALRAGALPVHDAGAEDEREFLSHLAAIEDPVKLLSDDLVPGELALQTLKQRYSAQGLLRGRSLFVVRDEQGVVLGWSLVETMSRGLFWAEIYSSFRVFLKNPSGVRAAEARACLAAHAVELAAREGQEEAECHAAPDDVASFGALGFVALGRVYEFGAHRSAVPELTQALGAVLARMRRRESKHWGEEALALQNY